MTNNRFHHLALTFLLMGFAALPSTAQSPEANIRESIEAVNMTFMKAFGMGDAEGVAALYTADSVLLAPHFDSFEGRGAVTAYMRGAIEQGLTEIELKTVEVEGEGDTAYEVGKYTLFAGNQRVDRGKYLVVWKRDQGVWRLHRDVMNTSIPSEKPAERARPESIGAIQWSTTAAAQSGLLDQEFTFQCPPGGRIGSVWGTDLYTLDSSLCSAAVHEGLITAPKGGVVTIRIKGGKTNYVGTTRNEVTSSNWGSYNGSFEFVD
ncbi:MAG: SgcJ/EcaC family oxidoreductase [Deltaproteobacteria bacterium]|nr:SgcJ/EcaC family oxidoreductase [Deltaproteobacteria bacterium]